MIHVRNLRKGEASSLPTTLSNTGMPFLDEPWVWVVEIDDYSGPFAIIVCSFAHGWLVLWRILSLSPLPSTAPLTWFMEALPQVFTEAHSRGCVGFMTLLANDRPEEIKIARIISRLAQGGIMPFNGSIAAGMLN